MTMLEAVQNISHNVPDCHLMVPHLSTLLSHCLEREQEATIQNLMHAVGGPLIGNKSLVQHIENDSKIKDLVNVHAIISSISLTQYV